MISKYLVQDVMLADHAYGQGSTRTEVNEVPMGAGEKVNGNHNEDLSHVKFVEQQNADVGNGDHLLHGCIQGGIQSYTLKSVLLTDIADGTKNEGITGNDSNAKQGFGYKSEILHGDFGPQFMASHVVPSLGIFCQRMFYDPMVDGNGGGMFGTGTKLAAFYTHVARQNVSRNVLRNDLSCLTRPDQLNQICFRLFALPKDIVVKTTLQDSRNIQHALDVDRSDDNVYIRGGFGDARTSKNELITAGFKNWGMKPIGVNGGIKIMEPFRDIQCILHQGILTALNIPMRISLRDLMIRFEFNFNESHAQFLCINLLKGLKFLHSLNVIHGQMAPSHVIFTQNGYPCLTYIERYNNVRPKIPARLEYSSPEEISSQPITAATDVFRTGLMIYFLLFSKSPFKADSHPQTKENLLNRNFLPRFGSGTMSKDGSDFLMKLLKTEPSHRFKLDKCRKSLEKTVQWFKIYDGEELSDQIYPSPFREFLLTAGLEE